MQHTDYILEQKNYIYSVMRFHYRSAYCPFTGQKKYGFTGTSHDKAENDSKSKNVTLHQINSMLKSVKPPMPALVKFSTNHIVQQQ